jgi:hypothetical protein
MALRLPTSGNDLMNARVRKMRVWALQNTDNT